MRLLRFARNDENSRIPRLKSKIPRDCFASLAMTRILEFPSQILEFLSKKYPRTPKNPNKKLEFPSKNSNFYAKIKEKFRIKNAHNFVFNFAFSSAFNHSFKR